jgi:hypothetical protein
VLGMPRHIGKEGNKLEGRMLGGEQDERDFQEDYGDLEMADFVSIVRPALNLFTAARLAELSGHDPSTVKRIAQADRRARLTRGEP